MYSFGQGWPGLAVAARGFLFAVGLLVFLTILVSPLAHADKRNPSVRFDLDYPEARGALNPGEAFDLAVSLSGVARGKDSIVAIVEGEPFGRRLVPMLQDPGEKRFRCVVRLEPYLAGLVSPREKALRITVTFARLRGMRLTRFLTRTTYLTMTLPDNAAELNPESYREADREPITGVELERGVAPGLASDPQPSARPYSAEEQNSITEQDLIVTPIRSREPAYWEHISHLVSRSWSGPAGHVSRKKAKGTVEVRFRLYANGEAQLIQVERSSGSRSVDEAGMQAILNAHPFPPFPVDVVYESVDLHVELTRSGRAVQRALRPASSRATVSSRP